MSQPPLMVECMPFNVRLSKSTPYDGFIEGGHDAVMWFLLLDEFHDDMGSKDSVTWLAASPNGHGIHCLDIQAMSFESAR